MKYHDWFKHPERIEDLTAEHPNVDPEVFLTYWAPRTEMIDGINQFTASLGDLATAQRQQKERADKAEARLTEAEEIEAVMRTLILIYPQAIPWDPIDQESDAVATMRTLLRWAERKLAQG